MMGRNIIAIIATLLCTPLARMILGLSIVAHSDGSGSELRPGIEASWGVS